MNFRARDFARGIGTEGSKGKNRRTGDSGVYRHGVAVPLSGGRRQTEETGGFASGGAVPWSY